MLRRAVAKNEGADVEVKELEMRPARSFLFSATNVEHYVEVICVVFRCQNIASAMGYVPVVQTVFARDEVVVAAKVEAGEHPCHHLRRYRPLAQTKQGTVERQTQSMLSILLSWMMLCE